MKRKMLAILKSIAYGVITFIAQNVVTIIYSIILAVIMITNNPEILNSGDIAGYEGEIMEMYQGNFNLILLIASIFATLVLFLIYKIRKKKVKRELMFYKTDKSNILIALGLGISCLLLNTGALSLVYEMGFLKEHIDYTNDLLAPISQGNIFIAILSVGIVGPIAEEYLFRGVIFNTLKKGFSMKWAIIIQGVFFGIYHFNLIQGIYATLLGIVFGYITYKTKSIWPAIIVHIVNNTVSVLMSYYLSDVLASIGVYIGFAVVGLIATVILVALIKKRNHNYDEDLELESIV